MESLLKCRKFEVVRRDVRSSDESVRPLEYILHPGAVVILPLLSPHQCLLIREFRPSIQLELWELPAGTLDRPGESPGAAAARELEEETGHRAGGLSELCSFYPSPGILTERIVAFVATDLRRTAQRLEATEQIQVEAVATDEALRMARDGRIMDGKTIITLLRWAALERERR